MEIKTIVKLTKEEKIALIKAYEILSDLDTHVWNDEVLDAVGDTIYDLSRIMDTLGEKYNVNWFQLDE